MMAEGKSFRLPGFGRRSRKLSTGSSKRERRHVRRDGNASFRSRGAVFVSGRYPYLISSVHFPASHTGLVFNIRHSRVILVDLFD